VRAASIATAVLLLLCVPAQAGQHAAPVTENPEIESPSKREEARQSWPPMTFFIAKGEPNACGPGCHEWIAADGRIDAETPARLSALLAQIGRRKLPIYFDSPGGSVPASIEIGRLMRAREMTAGVARTIPQGCDPLRLGEPACERRKRSGAALAAELRTLNASCNSACVYALIGAKVREVASDAGLGVHRISITQTTVRTSSSGRVRTSTVAEPSDSLSMLEMNDQLARYTVEMGISVALIEVATAVPNDQLRFITRDEIVRFGIDARDFDESRWTLHALRSGAWFIVKGLTLTSGGEPKRYRTQQLMLLCGRGGTVRVGLARDIDPGDTMASAALGAGGSEIALSRTRPQPKAGDADAPREIWVANAPKSFFARAASGETLNLIETGAGNAPPRRIALSTLGLPAAVDALGRRCQ
jgi:hypothetical protein